MTSKRDLFINTGFIHPGKRQTGYFNSFIVGVLPFIGSKLLFLSTVYRQIGLKHDCGLMNKLTLIHVKAG